MKILKKILVFLLVVLIGIQFFHPKKNVANGPFAADIASVYPVPPEVNEILKTSCNDCHSNNTYYPWYNNIQPVAWWLNDHVKEGKGEVNFNEFGTYRIGKQYRKLLEIKEQIEEGEMPLTSYTLIHSTAKLNEKQKELMINWADSLRSIIRSKYPADSLVTKRPKS